MASTTEPPTRELEERLREDRRRRPPERRRRRELGGRRLQPAGIAILVMLIAAGVGVLLNAQGLRKAAQIQPQGVGRDLGMALTKPLVSVSHALLLDRPRQGLKDALGRSDDDKVDTTIALPAPETGKGGKTGGSAAGSKAHGNGTAAGGGKKAHQAKPKPPAKEAFSPTHKLTFYVGGDSLSITPGESIERILPGTKVIKPVAPVDGQVATGLERPDVVNWFTRVPEQIQKYDPKVVILTFGANDDHSYMTGTPPGVDPNAAFGSAAWVKEYRRRVGGLMDIATKGGRFLVWIGIPIVRSADQNRHFQILNRIYESEAAKRPGRVAYLDTYDLFKDKNGNYADYLPNKHGQLIQVREPDGVHIRAEGGDVIAWQVLKKLRDQFDLTSWKKSKRG